MPFILSFFVVCIHKNMCDVVIDSSNYNNKNNKLAATHTHCASKNIIEKKFSLQTQIAEQTHNNCDVIFLESGEFVSVCDNSYQKTSNFLIMTMSGA